MHWSVVRKDASNFGYDWAPVVETQGIWRPVYAVGYNQFYIADVMVNSMSIPSNPTTPLVSHTFMKMEETENDDIDDDDDGNEEEEEEEEQEEEEEEEEKEEEGGGGQKKKKKTMGK